MRFLNSTIFNFVASLILLIAALPAGAVAELPAPQETETPGDVIGHGDGKIHIIPALSAPSVKNGGKLTIQAVVKAVVGVREVRAEILDGERVVDSLNLTSGSNGVPEGVMGPFESMSQSAAATMGLWSAEWTAHGLEEKHYQVRLRVTDGAGHSFEDASLTFSDPVAGITTPGTTAYPNGGLRRVGAHAAGDENYLRSVVIDAANGYAFFGTFTSPGTVVKVALGSGAAAPTRVGSITLDPGENQLFTGVIDTANGYAYFATYTTPGRVVKVALGAGAAAPTRVGAVTLNAGENLIYSGGVIDTANGYAYFGTETSPGIVVKVALGAGAAAPTRVGAVTLNAGEDALDSGVIDAANGYAYFGTGTSPGIVVKVALGAGAAAPTRVGAVTLNAGENSLWGSVIDAANGYAYFGTATSPAIIVKVALGAGAAAPTRTGAVTLSAGENLALSAAIDAANGYAYFGTYTSPGRVVKVALGAGAAAPTRTAAVTLNAGENNLISGTIDTSDGYAYFGTDTAPGRVVKVELGAGAAAPTRTDAVTLVEGENQFAGAVIDAANGYAYLGTITSPGRVVKIVLGAGTAAPSRVGAVTLGAGEIQIVSAVIDTANGYAYFGTNTSPGVVVKVALGAGAAAPTRVGAVTLNSGEDYLKAAAIDATNGYAYFATETSPGRVVKIALGSGAVAPTRVGAVTLNSGEDILRSAVIDSANGYGYFGAVTSPGIVVKVALGAGAAAPTRVGALTLNAGENSLTSAAVDVANGYAYFGTFTTPGRVVKVALGAGAAAPTRVGAVTLNSGEDKLWSAVIDAANGYAYFGTDNSPGIVAKVALGAGGSAPTRMASVTLNSGENQLLPAAIDSVNGYVYFGTNTSPGRLVKVAISEAGSTKATKTTLVETAIVSDVHFYSHTASGNIRLAIYDNSATKNLLWQSGSVANGVAGAFVDVPISSGTPSSLTLNAGTYWLVWQVDSTGDVPSYTAGSSGDGFYLAQTFGAFPATIASGTETSSSEKWTEYITYSVPAPEIDISPAGPIAFGDQDIDLGSTAGTTVTITNTGTATLTFTGNEVELTGADAGEFTILSDSGEPTLAPSASRFVVVGFSPSSLGAKSANLTITSDDSDEATVDVALTGTGTDQEIDATTGPLVFGDQDVDAGATANLQVTITNTGTADLAISSIGIVLGDTGEFGITGDSAEPTLAPTESRTVDVAFDPTTVGVKAATLRIVSDDTDEGTIDVALAGNGIDQELLVTGGPLDFGLMDVDDGTTGPLALTVANSGTNTLNFTGGTPFDITGPNAADFSFAVAPDASSLAPGADRQVTLLFNPSGTGIRTATLTITSDGGTVNVALSGEGIDQEIDVSPLVLNFGSRPLLAGAGATQTVTIENNGTRTLSFTGAGIVLGGLEPASFVFAPAPSTDPIEPGGSREVKIAFNPLAPEGAKSATLTITTDDTDEPSIEVTLNGTAAGTASVRLGWKQYK